MRDPWRYKLPCGHVSYETRFTNPASERYVCETCQKRWPEGSVIDKKLGRPVGQ